MPAAALLPLLLALPLHAADVVRVDRGHLARVGEALGGAPVERIEQHPEFERLTVRLPGGALLPLEVTLARPETSPACVHHGFAVYPRFELVGGQVLPEASPVTAALCARLEAQGGSLPLGVVRLDVAGPEAAPTDQAGTGQGVVIHIPGPGTRSLRPLHAVLAALGLALLAAAGPLRRALAGAPWRDGLGVAVAGLAARLLLSPRGLQIAPDAGYELLVQAWGINQPHPLYGDGYTALHAPLQRLLAWDPAALFGLHLGLSALAPPLLWAIGWLALRQRWGALTAGVGLALLPVALRLAASEMAHVPLATFELLALLAAVALAAGASQARISVALSLVAALAGGFALHLRPEALPFALLPLLLLLATAARHRSWRPLPAVLLLLLLLAWRLSDLPAPQEQGPVQVRAFLSGRLWRAVLLPPMSPLAARVSPFQVFLDPRTTPVVLPLLALVGATLGARRHGRVVLACLLWWGLSLLPILPKAWPLVDAWRLQLAGQAPLLLLAGVGVATLPRARPLAPALVVLSALPHLGFVRQQWAGMAEWAFLPRAVATLPPGATVLFPDHEVHAVNLAQAGALLQRRAGHPRPWWVPMGPFAATPAPGPDLFAWVGLTCRIEALPGRHVANDLAVNPCLQLARACVLTPFALTTLPEATDLDLALVDPPVQVGLYRVDGCGGPASPDAASPR